MAAHGNQTQSSPLAHPQSRPGVPAHPQTHLNGPHAHAGLSSATANANAGLHSHQGLGPSWDTPSTPLPLVALLYQRIAVLENELAHARSDKAAAQAANQTLVQHLTSLSRLDDDDDARSPEAVADSKLRVAALRQENARLKSKLRKSLVEGIKVRTEARIARAKESTDSSAAQISSGRPVSGQSGQLHGKVLTPDDAVERDSESGTGPLIDSPVPTLSYDLLGGSRAKTPTVANVATGRTTRQGTSLYLDQLEDLSPDRPTRRHDEAKSFGGRGATLFHDRPGYTGFSPDILPDSGAPKSGKIILSQGTEEALAEIFRLDPTPLKERALLLRDGPDIGPAGDGRAPTYDKSPSRIHGSDASASMPEFVSSPAGPPRQSSGSSLKDHSRGTSADGDQVFGSVAERSHAIALHSAYAGKDEQRLPAFFSFGICFSPSNDDGDVHRTVVVGNLPEDVTLTGVLDRVRGGMVISAKLMDTVNITGSVSAMIVFLHAFCAEEYAGFAQSHPILVGGRRISVCWLPTPTFPAQLGVTVAIREHGHTRCLQVSRASAALGEEVLKAVSRTLWAVTINVIEHHERGPDGSLRIRFYSVDAAGRAYGVLKSRPAFRSLAVGFVADPCALPLSTLGPEEEEDVVSVSTEAHERALLREVDAAIVEARSTPTNSHECNLGDHCRVCDEPGFDGDDERDLVGVSRIRNPYMAYKTGFTA
ncbi:MAG: hypothetical protein M1832_006429 [Thelocarpon impressellum]|nr:MAG: hypothetical protein M1832_006429 [Thelocarpon impressellum]